MCTAHRLPRGINNIQPNPHRQHIVEEMAYVISRSREMAAHGPKEESLCDCHPKQKHEDDKTTPPSIRIVHIIDHFTEIAK